MKKIILLIVALFLLVFVVIGCGENTDTSNNDNNDVAAEEVAGPQPEPQSESEPELVEGMGEYILKQGERLDYFIIVESIEVYQQEDKAWAVIKTTETKDFDDSGWCKEIARLTISYSQGVFYLDEAIVLNADGIQIASMRNWVPKE